MQTAFISTKYLIFFPLSKNQKPGRFNRTGWWAGQDSNLQPDRYERPALTIELPARPERASAG
jgi:hypothetical protein